MSKVKKNESKKKKEAVQENSKNVNVLSKKEITKGNIWMFIAIILFQFGFIISGPISTFITSIFNSEKIGLFFFYAIPLLSYIIVIACIHKYPQRKEFKTILMFLILATIVFGLIFWWVTDNWRSFP